MPALIQANRSVAASPRLLRVAAVSWLIWLLLGIVGGPAGTAAPMLPPVGGHGMAGAATATGAAPAGAFAEDVDDHEQCALVEALPEANEHAAAAPAPWPAFDAGGPARAGADMARGPWRRAPARRKCARGPPAIAI